MSFGKINKWHYEITATESQKSALLSSQMRFSPVLITAVLLLISPCSQMGCRQTSGGWWIDSLYCIAQGKWRTSLPVVSLHLLSVPLISTPQQLASDLVTGKWYSAGSVWEEMAGYGTRRSRGRATDSHVKGQAGHLVKVSKGIWVTPPPQSTLRRLCVLMCLLSKISNRDLTFVASCNAWIM